METSYSTKYKKKKTKNKKKKKEKKISSLESVDLNSNEEGYDMVREANIKKKKDKSSEEESLYRDIKKKPLVRLRSSEEDDYNDARKYADPTVINYVDVDPLPDKKKKSEKSKKKKKTKKKSKKSGGGPKKKTIQRGGFAPCLPCAGSVLSGLGIFGAGTAAAGTALAVSTRSSSKNQIVNGKVKRQEDFESEEKKDGKSKKIKYSISQDDKKVVYKEGKKTIKKSFKTAKRAGEYYNKMKDKCKKKCKK